MVKKYFLLCIFLSTALIIPSFVFAQSSAGKDAQSILSTFMFYTESRVSSVQKSLETIASTTRAKSGEWKNIKGLLAGYQKKNEDLITWYVRHDGTYYTVDSGLIAEKLSDRSYFPPLMAGEKITGALVVSKSTGKRSAVIAVPVIDRGVVIGAVGATVFLDKLSEKIASELGLQANMTFFALSQDGITALHTATDRHFLDPRELGSETLKTAADEMLSNDSGEVSYEFDNATKKALYRRGPLTRWTFVITSSDGQ